MSEERGARDEEPKAMSQEAGAGDYSSLPPIARVKQSRE